MMKIYQMTFQVNQVTYCHVLLSLIVRRPPCIGRGIDRNQRVILIDSLFHHRRKLAEC